jgi:hypothetical protein
MVSNILRASRQGCGRKPWTLTCDAGSAKPKPKRKRKQETCYKCDHKSDPADHKDHLKNCLYTRCEDCKTSKILLVDIKAHRESCLAHNTTKRCGKCWRRFALDIIDDHHAACEYRPRKKKACGKCNKTFLPEELHDHRAGCDWYPCAICRKCMPGHEKEARRQGVCGNFYQCKSCNKVVPRVDRDAHLRICKGKKGCHRCAKSFPREEIKLHCATCDWWQCDICYKTMHQDHKVAHLQGICGTLNRCRACREIMPSGDYVSHREACQKFCQGCGQYFPREEIVQHREDCDGDWCHRCGKRILKVDFNQHMLDCPMCKCSVCRARMECSQLQEHMKVCPKIKCPLCRAILTRTGTALDIHLEQCPGPQRDR